jgi:type IV secretion system protein VirD4
MLVFGHRRLTAATLVGLISLDAVITDDEMTETQVKVWHLTENVHRADLTGFEKYLACTELMCMNPTWRMRDLAKHLHLDPSMVTRLLSPSKCSPAWQEALKDGKVRISDCYCASKLESPKEQDGLLALKLSGASRDEIEQAGCKLRNGIYAAVKIAKVMFDWFMLMAIGVVAYLYRKSWRSSGRLFGTAEWASDKGLNSWGLLADQGLILGRTVSGALIQMPRNCHVLLVGATGSGKGVSIVNPNLLRYTRGAVVCFDTKGDLFETTAQRRGQRGQKVFRLVPFNEDANGFNPLNMIVADSPTLTNSARTIAEALVVRQGTESDQHWNDKAVQGITAVLVFVLIRFKREERSLNTVQDIVSDPAMLRMAADKLIEMRGIPTRLGRQLKALFKKGSISKEGSSILSTMACHLPFLESSMVAKSLATNGFDLLELTKLGMTLFLQIPPEQFEAQKRLLWFWVSTLIRIFGFTGNKRKSEVLFLIDDVGTLESLSVLKDSLVRGRSAGVRMLLAYQSDSQVKAAFKVKLPLLKGNCTTQIYLGASTYETAERISKSLGDYTQAVHSYGVNNPQSWSQSQQGEGQGSRGSSMSYSQTEWTLLKLEEILSLSDDYLIAFLRELPPPVLVKQINWDFKWDKYAVAAEDTLVRMGSDDLYPSYYNAA